MKKYKFYYLALVVVFSLAAVSYLFYSPESTFTLSSVPEFEGQAGSRMPSSVGASVMLTKISDVSTMYGTFQSHNPLVVSNQYGIFLSYLNSRVDSGGYGNWRLARSLDGGRTFTTIYQANQSTNPPTLLTDRDGNIFLIHSNYTPSSSSGNATFYRFSPESGFRNPRIVSIPKGSSGKYTGYYDSYRNVIYYATFWDHPTPNFYILNKDGGVIYSTSLTLPGSTSRLQYPQLEMGGSTLYYAWTTSPLNAGRELIYRAIQYIYSEDGGYSWKTSKNPQAPLKLPFVADETGPGVMVNLQEELDVQTWLSHFLYKDGNLNFMYQAAMNPSRQHYVRIRASSGQRSKDIYPTWKGSQISLMGLDGFFATKSQDSSTPLYAVGNSQYRVGVLVSNDSGNSWNDYAVGPAAPRGYNIYALGGSRKVSSSGHILGLLTRQDYVNNSKHSVWFVKIPTASVTSEKIYYGKLNLATTTADSGYAYVASQDFATTGDSMQAHTISKLRLFENGVELGTAHSMHADIRSSGRGKFSHWGNALYFSASDNSDPRKNGRVYTFSISSPVSGMNSEACGIIDMKQSRRETGYAYYVDFSVNMLSDNMTNGIQSPLVIYENGLKLGPAHSMHADIRAQGRGRYSHWDKAIYFSTSDNSDPRTNGREYSYSGNCGSAKFSE